MGSSEINVVNWREDTDFEEYKIEGVKLDMDHGEKGLWVVTLEFGFTVEWPRGGAAPQPREGQVARIFGDVDGVWGPRGIVVGDKVAYFRTPQEQVEWLQARENEEYEEAKTLFRAVEEDLRERFALLPEVLRNRIEAARKESSDPEKFDVLMLEEEIVLHEHGHMIALVADTEATLETFIHIPNQGQMGYSWNAMCDERLAAIDTMLKAADITEEVRQHLLQDAEYLKRYQERRFFVRHDPGALIEIFGIATELVKAEIRH